MLPLQGDWDEEETEPRALPWAGLGRPFRPEQADAQVRGQQKRGTAGNGLMRMGGSVAEASSFRGDRTTAAIKINIETEAGMLRPRYWATLFA